MTPHTWLDASLDGSVEGTQRVEVECLERRPHVEVLVSSKPDLLRLGRIRTPLVRGSTERSCGSAARQRSPQTLLCDTLTGSRRARASKACALCYRTR